MNYKANIFTTFLIVALIILGGWGVSEFIDKVNDWNSCKDAMEGECNELSDFWIVFLLLSMLAVTAMAIFSILQWGILNGFKVKTRNKKGRLSSNDQED